MGGPIVETIDVTKSFRIPGQPPVEVLKGADLAVWTGDPLSNMSRCKYTVIDGEVYENF